MAIFASGEAPFVWLCPHDDVSRVYDDAGNVIEAPAGKFTRPIVDRPD